MARSPSASDTARSNSLVTVAIIVAALYFGRGILLPFGLAILLSFLLAPLAEWLEKRRWGRIPSVLMVVSLAFVCIVVLTFVLGKQAYDLAYRLPEYKDNIVAKMQFLEGDGDGILDRVTATLKDLRTRATSKDEEVEPEPEPKTATESAVEIVASQLGLKEDDKRDDDVRAKPPDRDNPLPVEVIKTLTVTEIAQSVIGPVLAPLGAGGLVIIFVIFMLLNREDLRNRLIHLIGDDQIHVTTQALDDAAARVSRYLLMQLIINASYGLVIAIGLAIIGLPNALLWGVLTAILRFIPYVGPWIAALMPIAVSLAVSENWATPGWVIVLFVINELISNNVMEPWLYGSSTGISTIGILASAVFWAWIWGPVGLVMATPLTVCLTVMGRYVPQLAFLNTMLSDEDVVPAPSRYYQRLLAQDPEEAMEIAEEFLAANSLEQLYEMVLVPALTFAEQDRKRDRLDDSKYAYIVQSTREVVDELAERPPLPKSDDESGDELGDESDGEPETVPPPVSTEVSLLCVPARSEADEVAGIMLAHLLEDRGVRAVVGSHHALSGETTTRIENEQISLVCISALPPLAATQARYRSKRLRAKLPSIKIIAGVWQASGITKKSQERLTAGGVDRIALTLSAAAAELEQLVKNLHFVKTSGEMADTAQEAETDFKDAPGAKEKGPPDGEGLSLN